MRSCLQSSSLVVLQLLQVVLPPLQLVPLQQVVMVHLQVVLPPLLLQVVLPPLQLVQEYLVGPAVVMAALPLHPAHIALEPCGQDAPVAKL